MRAGWARDTVTAPTHLIIGMQGMRERGENTLQGQVLIVLTTSLCLTRPASLPSLHGTPWDRVQLCRDPDSPDQHGLLPLQQDCTLQGLVPCV